MKRINGASRQVLGWIRTDDFYTSNNTGAEVRMKPNKPTGRRKVVNASVKPDGSWGRVGMVHV